MKVLQVIDGLGTGGAERSLAESLPYFISAGIRVLIVCHKNHEEGVQAQVRSLEHGVRVLTSTSFTGRVLELRKLIQSENADLIHTTLFEADISGRLAAIGCGIPVLTSLVNTSYEPIRHLDPNVTWPKLWGAKTIDGWTGRHLTTHFHAISHAVKEAAIHRLKLRPERITVIERGRNPTRLGSPSEDRRRAARRALGLSESDEVLVNVGRQEYQKGQLILLKAMATLAPKRQRLKLLIAGRMGNASQELQEALTRLALTERVRFLGYREDVPEIMAAADLFILPSLYEGLGGVLIEAMALGLPIVASDIPAVREVVEEGGNALIAPCVSPDELGSHIERLLDEPELAQRFAERGIQIFEERFTLEKSAKRMIRLYLAIAKPRAVRGCFEP